jgi:uncharacterized iron-regulated membrane protein
MALVGGESVLLYILLACFVILLLTLVGIVVYSFRSSDGELGKYTLRMFLGQVMSIAACLLAALVLTAILSWLGVDLRILT